MKRTSKQQLIRRGLGLLLPGLLALALISCSYTSIHSYRMAGAGKSDTAAIYDDTALRVTIRPFIQPGHSRQVVDLFIRCRSPLIILRSEVSMVAAYHRLRSANQPAIPRWVPLALVGMKRSQRNEFPSFVAYPPDIESIVEPWCIPVAMRFSMADDIVLEDTNKTITVQFTASLLRDGVPVTIERTVTLERRSEGYWTVGLFGSC